VTDWTATTDCSRCADTDQWADIHRPWHALVAALPWWRLAHWTVGHVDHEFAPDEVVTLVGGDA
jgi:hypothetical protein